MKSLLKKILIILSTSILFCLIFSLVGCSQTDNPDNGENNGDSGNETPIEAVAEITSFDGATINGEKISMFVEHEIDSVSLSGKVQVSKDCIWKLYSDKLGRNEIPTKVAASNSGELLDGDNQFYILVSSNTEDKINFYELTIHRSYEVDITYWFNDEIYKTEKAFTGKKFDLIEFNKNGYTFNYWATTDNMKAEETVIWETQNFYANTTKNSYIVTFDCNEGVEDLEAKTVTFDEDFSFPIPTKNGYIFRGWYLEGAGYLLTNENGISLKNWDIPNNATVIAQWQPRTFKVTVENNTPYGNITGGGFFPCGNQITISATVYLGYDFAGWYIGDKKISDLNEYTFYVEPNNITYIAHYKVAKEMEIFDFSSGVNNCEITKLKTTSINELAIPIYVTRIKSNSFQNCSIKKLIFNEMRYCYIEEFAFSGCSIKEAYFVEDVEWMLRAQTDNRPYGDFFRRYPAKISPEQNATDLSQTLSHYSWNISRQ